MPARASASPSDRASKRIMASPRVNDRDWGRSMSMSRCSAIAAPPSLSDHAVAIDISGSRFALPCSTEARV